MNASFPRTLVAFRIGTIIVGCIAVWWGLSVFPVFWREATIEGIARRIIAGEAYKTETLEGQLPVVEAAENARFCRPAGRRSAAIIRLRLAEDAVRKGTGPLELRVDEARASIRNSLSCSPADPFLWAVLFWIESIRNGFHPDYLNFLRMSYQLGPNEGWIALNRNPLAFAVYDKLPEDISSSVIREFIGILESGFYDQAIAIFTGPAWERRDLILAQLARVSYPHRLAFAKALRARDLNLAVPGIRRLDLGPDEPR